MPTTQTTSGSNTSNLQFNPIAQSLYNQLIQGGGGVLQGYMSNPFGNPAYTMGAAQSQAGAQQAGQNNMAALSQNALTNGLTGQAGAGFMAAQKAQTGRANQAMSSQANIQNVMGALQRQMSAAGTGLSFSPQLTGQTGNFQQSSQLGGLGSFSQLFGGGLGALLGGLGGMGAGAAGASSMASQVPSFGSGPNPNFMSSLQNPFGGAMAGMGSGGLAGMLGSGGTSNSFGTPNPFASLMNPQQQ